MRKLLSIVIALMFLLGFAGPAHATGIYKTNHHVDTWSSDNHWVKHWVYFRHSATSSLLSKNQDNALVRTEGIRNSRTALRPSISTSQSADKAVHCYLATWYTWVGKPSAYLMELHLAIRWCGNTRTHHVVVSEWTAGHMSGGPMHWRRWSGDNKCEGRYRTCRFTANFQQGKGVPTQGNVYHIDLRMTVTWRGTYDRGFLKHGH